MNAEDGEGKCLGPNQVYQSLQCAFPRSSMLIQYGLRDYCWPSCSPLISQSSCYLPQPALEPWGGQATALLQRGPPTFPVKLPPVFLVKELLHQPQDIGVYSVPGTTSHQSPTSNCSGAIDMEIHVHNKRCETCPVFPAK